MKKAASFAVSPNAWMSSITGNLSAAGNSQGTGTAIPSGQDVSVFTAVSASQGCVLPVTGVSAGETYTVCNLGASALSIYPQAAGRSGCSGQVRLTRSLQALA